jgi:hypothetical protein
MPFRKRKRYRDDGQYSDPSSSDEKAENRMDAKESKWDHKTDKRETKIDGKVQKQEAKTEKAYATAAKRNALASLLKWVVILIGVVYAITKLGGLGGAGGLLETVKGWLPQ